MTESAPVVPRGRVTIASVLEHVAFETEFPREDIVGVSRKTHLVRSRYAAAWLARRHTGKTLRQIGRVFGNRDHATILHEVHRAVQLREADAYFRWLTDHLDALLLTVSGEDAPREIADAVMERFERARGCADRRDRARAYSREGMTLWHRLALAHRLESAA